MRNRIILLFFLFLPVAAFSQVVVSDPALEQLQIRQAQVSAQQQANTAKTLLEAKKHTDELTKSTDFLKKSYDRLHEVNSYINNLNQINSLAKRQESLIDKTSKTVSDMQASDLFTPDEMTQIHGEVTRMISNTTRIMELLKLALEPKTAMSDAERLTMLRDMEADFRERQGLMETTLYQYDTLKKQRILNKSLEALHNK